MSTSSIHILGFAGSLRRASVNRGLLRAASEKLPANVTLEIYDLSDIPLYNGDVEASGTPDSVQDFKQRIAAADALLIATPEYNYSIPGVLKNAIDWASRPPASSPLSGKPAAILGAGGGYGTVRAQTHLRNVLAAVNVQVLTRPEVLIQNARDKFNADGNLLDAESRQRVWDLIDALAVWTRRLRTGEGTLIPAIAEKN
ncbi:MAG: NAD(P)H-dependent oxidoreductase [Anaerolineaceae bacterium]